MSNYSPISALIFFLVGLILLVLIFKPKGGLYFRFRKRQKATEKIAIEDILKLLYHQSKYTEKDILKELEYSPHLLQESLQKMIKKQLILLNKGVYELTEQGLVYALRIVRAHRLWEKYLSEKTGFDKQEWHGRAELKEHELTEEEVENLAVLLGNPRFDPHGDPIPTKKGKVQKQKGQLLSRLEVDTLGKIIHLEDEPATVYQEILDKKIHLGSQIKVIKHNEEEVRFLSEGVEFSVSTEAAQNISISVLEETEFSEESSMRLSNLRPNEVATVLGISKESRGESRRRLLDLGFVKGADVSVNLLNPLSDPTAFLIKGTAIALRKDQSEKILIKRK